MLKPLYLRFLRVPSEARLLIYVVLLYATFIFWGYLQEKITTTNYSCDSTGNNESGEDTEPILRWDFPFVLNFCMAFSTCLTAGTIEMMSDKNRRIFSPLLFWKPALSATLASPIGYESLKYINYPLMILTKSSKPVPVMAVGMVFYKRRYQWYKYMCVLLLCGGICFFTAGKQTTGTGAIPQEHAGNVSHELNNTTNISINDSTLTNIGQPIASVVQIDDSSGGSSFAACCYGLLLVFINLSMDGYTNNEQDQIFMTHRASAAQMMKYTNAWQCLYQLGFLLIDWVIRGMAYIVGLNSSGSTGSQIALALNMLWQSPSLRAHVLLFCLCASVGQVFIFQLIQEFGSLVWVTVSVTRQLFTILLSVLLFGHRVNSLQWMGVLMVFLGLGAEVMLDLAHKQAQKRKIYVTAVLKEWMQEVCRVSSSHLGHSLDALHAAYARGSAILLFESSSNSCSSSSSSSSSSSFNSAHGHRSYNNSIARGLSSGCASGGTGTTTAGMQFPSSVTSLLQPLVLSFDTLYRSSSSSSSSSSSTKTAITPVSSSAFTGGRGGGDTAIGVNLRRGMVDCSSDPNYHQFTNDTGNEGANNGYGNFGDIEGGIVTSSSYPDYVMRKQVPLSPIDKRKAE